MRRISCKEVVVGVILASSLGFAGYYYIKSKQNVDNDTKNRHQSELKKVKTSTVVAGEVTVYRSLPGEIVAHPDSSAHINPRVRGILKKIVKNLGDEVKSGDTLAIIESNRGLSEFRLSALLPGRIIKLDASEGEVVDVDDEVFEIADLSKLRVNLIARHDDLLHLKVGQNLLIETGHNTVLSNIAYISPYMDDESGTATAFGDFAYDSGGKLQPGLFVSARVEIGKISVSRSIPLSALEQGEVDAAVYLYKKKRFQRRVVRYGMIDNERVEIISGLKKNDIVAANAQKLRRASLIDRIQE